MGNHHHTHFHEDAKRVRRSGVLLIRGTENETERKTEKFISKQQLTKGIKIRNGQSYISYS